MTSLRVVETGEVDAPSPTAQRVAEVVGTLPAVDLKTLDSRAALLTRIDRKYVVPLATFERLVDQLSDDWQALEIGGRRLFGYSSVYFDTPDFVTYRAHLQGRRRRYKVRVRRYVDSGDCMLEVKMKGQRGITVKERRPHPTWAQERLGEDDRAFVGTCVDGFGVPGTPDRMSPVVATTNRRATLASLSAGTRLTVDTDLVTGWEGAHSVLRPGYVLLESKVSHLGSEVDRRLRQLGVRPLTVSKFCIGVVSLGTGLPSNPWRRTMRSYFDTPTSEEN